VTAAVSKFIWLAFELAWFLMRLAPGRRSRRTPVRYSARGLREFVLLGASLTGLGIVPCLYVFTPVLRFANYPIVPVMSYLGILVATASLWLFHVTHRDLGRNWSVSLDLRERHTLVTSGIYAWVRHPMYAGFWLMAMAQILLLSNWVAGPAGLVGFGILYFGRVRREEEMMMAAFGDEYRAYALHTARLIPRIY
jgi:protein-S-isoprenylcysteine O-methyltransferase Ste14